MPATGVTAWLQFAIQQMAAESYLNGFSFSDTDELIRRLKLGNNDNPVNGPNDPILPGATRFVDLTGVPNASQVTGSAQAFISRYQIVDHHANDATGFSATVLFDTQTNSYTLSMRSSEYAADANGGDRSRDIFGADLEIGTKGFAFAQLVSMERYFTDLMQGKKSNGTIDPALAAFFGNDQNKFNVTGYSLSGHLATVFTELHENRVIQTYTFNGAGRGTFSVPGTEAQEVAKIRTMLTDLDTRLREFDPAGDLLQSGAAGNIYQDSRYTDALAATRTLYLTTGTSEIGPGATGGVPRSAGAFSKITQLFGHAVTGFDLEGVANSGIHARAQEVLIEGQPLLEGINNQFELQYGNTHSITLLVDSLALQELFQAVDPTLTQAQMEAIFKASSDAAARVIGQTQVAEGDTLELALDALRKVFVGPHAAPTGFNDNAGGFGDLSFRNPFYANLQAVKAALNGQTYQVVSLVNMPTENVKGHALLPGATGTAYRYALKELNPFVVLGANYTQFTTPGDLDLYDPATGNGSLTLEYLKDRASFLGRKIEINLNNGLGLVDQLNDIHWKDYTSNYEINPGVIFSLTPREYLFGGQGDDQLTGNIFADRLYGGDGQDTINGNGGKDYIEGNEGNDVLLSGGSGDDTIIGGQGDDTLDGGIGDDTLDGGLDNDTLKGGSGFDRYIVRFGSDTIEDSDGNGVVELNGKIVVGGLHRHGEPDNTWKSLDGQFTFVKQNSNLIINNTLTINNFTTGALSIHLAEAPNTATPVAPDIDFSQPFPSMTVSYDDVSNEAFLVQSHHTTLCLTSVRIPAVLSAAIHDIRIPKYLQFENGVTMYKFASLLVIGCVLVVLGQANIANGETVAERFDKAIKQIAKQCASRKLEPNEVCGEVAKLKPADPLATEEGRFAHSIKIPDPVPEDSGYKSGMTPEQYFDHLCKTEAGEFIYKTVENVEGLYMMRPRKEATDDELSHLYALEDPYGDAMGERGHSQDYLVQPPFGLYQFMEEPSKSKGDSTEKVRRYYRGALNESSKSFVYMKGSHSESVPYIIKSETVSDPASHFGYTWRGISRPHDRELGITGGELIVLDLRTKEVLGVRRAYIRSGGVRNNLTGIWWLGGGKCERFGARAPIAFIYDVLKPRSVEP